MKEERLEYIDIIKGVTIYFMVLGHSYSEGNGEYIMRWIYSFHMPLFFITTGVLYGMRNKTSMTFDLKKKVRTLLFPYLFWGTIYQIFLASLKIMGGAPIKETLYQNLVNVITITGSSMWFLPTMFGAFLVFFLLRCFIINNKVLITGSTLIMLLGIINASASNEFSIIVARILVGAGFISIGYFLEKMYNKEISMWLLIIFTIVHIFISMIVEPVSMVSLTIGNPIIYILMSSLGTFVVYEWCKKIKVDSKVGLLLSLWGRNSLKILCLHGFVIQVIRLFDYKIFGDILPLLGCGEGIVFSIVIMYILSFVLMKAYSSLDWTFGK